MEKVNDELISLALWTIRRLPEVHKEFAYNKLITIVGEHDYLKDVQKEISKYKQNEDENVEWRGFTD